MKHVTLIVLTALLSGCASEGFSRAMAATSVGLAKSPEVARTNERREYCLTWPNDPKCGGRHE